MNATVYLSEKAPAFACVRSETLSDGSIVWNLHFFIGDETHSIACPSEKSADEALTLVVAGLRVATSGNVLVL